MIKCFGCLKGDYMNGTRTRQTILMEQVTAMAEVKKSDCTSVQRVLNDTGIARNTLNAYMNALGIAKLKFPFDSKQYITNDDYRRIREFIAENRGETEE